MKILIITFKRIVMREMKNSIIKLSKSGAIKKIFINQIFSTHNYL